MKKTSLLISALLAALFCGCQPDYVDDIQDEPTDLIHFISLTASQDSALMYEPVTITAIAEGENLKYFWQKNKGSLVRERENVVNFWGCPTCLNWVTVSCTVSNEYGSITKEVKIFVKEERYQP